MKTKNNTLPRLTSRVKDTVLTHFGQNQFTSFDFKQKYINRYKNEQHFTEREHLHFYLLVKAGMFLRMARGKFVLSPGYQFVTDEQVRELNRINSYQSLMRKKSELTLQIPNDGPESIPNETEHVKEFDEQHAIAELKKRGYKISKVVTKYEEV